MLFVKWLILLMLSPLVSHPETIADYSAFSIPIQSFSYQFTVLQKREVGRIPPHLYPLSVLFLGNSIFGIFLRLFSLNLLKD